MLKKVYRCSIIFVITSLILSSISLSHSNIVNAYAAERADFDIDAKSAVLMDFSSGKILYQKNPHEKLPPASVTKVMTMLLTLEAVDSGKIKLSDKVTISEHACSMGGTQLFLAPGEIRTVEELLKGVSIESANDAAVALAEYLEGSEELFVKKMNERAKQLGMKDTNFSNCNGLPIENHYTSAWDIALMSRELLKHPKILDYTKVWMETLSEGRKQPFTMVNKNRLVKFYEGCDGLKTGSTSEAKFCISATALRNNMRLIASVMASPTRDIRNRETSKLLDYGFARYEVVKLADKNDIIGSVKVLKGKSESVKVAPKDSFYVLTEKGNKGEIARDIRISGSVSAEVKKGQKLGEIVASKNGEEISRMDLIALEDVKRAGSGGLISRTFGYWLNMWR
ncbi:MAG TPA: D-alanyl-D-alanine carboxypeptidase [Clostridiaceae bacterium]|nr:D-alanyl-D-alanine carboxypeptidase [Clostridiaceae bacterium]